MQAINFMTSSRPNPSIDPDTYAKNYAAQNGISVDEAKEQLKAQYGEPNKPTALSDTSSIFGSSEDNKTSLSSQLTCDFSELEDIIGELEDEIEGSGNSTLKNLFQKFLDFLKGGFGPQNEGDPQSHLGAEIEKVQRLKPLKSKIQKKKRKVVTQINI